MEHSPGVKQLPWWISNPEYFLNITWISRCSTTRPLATACSLCVRARPGKGSLSSLSTSRWSNSWEYEFTTNNKDPLKVTNSMCSRTTYQNREPELLGILINSFPAPNFSQGLEMGIWSIHAVPSTCYIYTYILRVVPSTSGWHSTLTASAGSNIFGEIMIFCGEARIYNCRQNLSKSFQYLL